MSDPFQTLADAAVALLIAQAPTTFPDVVVGGTHFHSVTEWDWTILDRGVTHALIFMPGKFSKARDPEARQSWRTWDLEFDLYDRYSKTRTIDMTDFVTMRGIVTGIFDLYPHLGNMLGITRSTLAATDEVRDVIKKAEANSNPEPVFMVQRFLLAVDYRFALSGGEYV